MYKIPFYVYGYSMPDHWNPVFAASHVCFRQLPDMGRWEGFLDWPDCSALMSLLPAGLQMQAGVPVRFLPQDEFIPFPELYYEERIFQYGIVATRQANWHDFFNALIWSVYPQTKLLISCLHAADLQAYGKPRTPQRDALTLFDENGVVIAATRRQLLEAILNFSWLSVFHEERAAWGREIGCFVFGHALLEKMLTPYIGVTAHALLMDVEEHFFTLSLPEQHACLDARLEIALRNGALPSPLHLTPVPVLGIPRWWENDDVGFYQDAGYFRAKSRQRYTQILG